MKRIRAPGGSDVPCSSRSPTGNNTVLDAAKQEKQTVLDSSKMKALWRVSLLHLLVYCSTQTFGVRILSVPDSVEGVVSVEVMSTVSLVCKHETAAESKDNELVWLRNGAVVKLAKGNKNGTSSVCISPAISEDNGAVFKCSLRANRSTQDSVTLNVQYKPGLSGSEDVSVEELTELSMRCDIWANPPVQTVVWTLNDQRVEHLGDGFTIYQDAYTSQLKISPVKQSMHKGAYKCTVDDKYSKTFRVTVTETTMQFPLYPIIAAAVVISLTVLLALVSRWEKITKCCR